MKKIFSIAFIFVSLLTVSNIAYALPTDAQNPKSASFQILPCDGTDINGGVPCDYNAAVNGFNNIVKFLLYISIPFATVMFAYAGFLYMRVGDNPGNKEKAKKIFINIAIGLSFILGAWLIVHTLILKLSPTLSGTNSII